MTTVETIVAGKPNSLARLRDFTKSLGELRKFYNYNGLPTLSPKEQQIFILIALGYSQKEMVEVLKSSRKTIQKHIQQVYNKTEIHNRIHIAHLALHLNLIPNIYGHDS